MSDRQRAIELENLPFSEKIKMRKDQEARQAKQRIISGHYEARVIVANEAKLKKNNDLLQKYIRQREQKMDTEATLKRDEREQYKASIMTALEEQTKQKTRAKRDQQ